MLRGAEADAAPDVQPFDVRSEASCLGVSAQEPGQTGAECDGVITLIAALLSAWHECPSSSTLKRHIIGPRGEWDILATDPQRRGQGEQGGR